MRLIVTRSEPDASRTAQALTALGHEAILSPAIDIVFHQTVKLPEARFQAVIATSSNGVRALAAHVGRAPLLSLPLFAVGDSSALEARRSGFTGSRSAGGGAADLIRLVMGELRPQDGPLLQLAGEVQAVDVAADLTRAGFQVETAVLYRVEPEPRIGSSAAAVLRKGEADGVLFYSPRSAAAFAAALRASDLAPMPASVTCFCLSAACAEPLESVHKGPVRVAERPDQISLFACIEAARNSASPPAGGN